MKTLLETYFSGAHTTGTALQINSELMFRKPQLQVHFRHVNYDSIIFVLPQSYKIFHFFFFQSQITLLNDQLFTQQESCTAKKLVMFISTVNPSAGTFHFSSPLNYQLFSATQMAFPGIIVI
jgi:hypothetical protein